MQGPASRGGCRLGRWALGQGGSSWRACRPWGFYPGQAWWVVPCMVLGRMASPCSSNSSYSSSSSYSSNNSSCRCSSSNSSTCLVHPVRSPLVGQVGRGTCRQRVPQVTMWPCTRLGWVQPQLQQPQPAQVDSTLHRTPQAGQGPALGLGTAQAGASPAPLPATLAAAARLPSTKHPSSSPKHNTNTSSNNSSSSSNSRWIPYCGRRREGRVVSAG
jgi:hypothetical protein